jgi:hypothetical protein
MMMMMMVMVVIKYAIVNRTARSPMDEWLKNNECGRIWKETAMV